MRAMALFVSCLALGCSGTPQPARESPALAGDIAIARSKAESICTAHGLYCNDHGGNGPPTLQSLLRHDAGPDGPYLTRPEALLDPWGKPFRLTRQGKHHKDGRPDVWTVAPNGQVVGNW